MSTARRLPAAVFVVAAAMAILHLVPTWIASAQAPADWVFTGNLRGSPDFMQYFTWARRTQVTGPLVDNVFTTEPNPPHLLVLPYYVVGLAATMFDTSPEMAYQYLGSAYAFVFVVVLFLVARTFLETTTQAWWVLFALLWGGGLSGYLKFLPMFPIAYSSLLERTVTYGERVSNLFEDHRGFLIFKTFFDSHFLLVWLVMTAAILALYYAIERVSAWRVALTAALFGAAGLVHIYEAVTLAGIAVGVLFFCWRKGLLRVHMVVTVGAACGVAAASVIVQVLIFRTGGLSLPAWHEVDVIFSTIVLAFPLAWALIAWGIGDYWSRAGLKECFLIGWMMACLAIMLSGPFYPYPTRGAQSFQIPVTVIAAAIYFHYWKRVTVPAALIAIVLLSGSSIWELRGEWRRAQFAGDRPYAFLDPGRWRITRDLAAADRGDLLFARSRDLLWIAPRYPGHHYCGHFFLTVDYERKCAELDAFYEAPAAGEAFLRRTRPRFIYVDRDDDPARFAGVPGLMLREDVPAGVLYEYEPQ